MTYELTGEELTYLMNGTYLQSGKYKIVYADYKPEIIEEYTITLTSKDTRDMSSGLEVKHKHFVFIYKYEPIEIYEELKISISHLRDMDKKGKEVDFYEITDAIGILYRAVKEAIIGDVYGEDQVMYILSAARKNILYLQKKLENVAQKDIDLYAKASRQIFEMKTYPDKETYIEDNLECI